MVLGRNIERSNKGSGNRMYNMGITEPTNHGLALGKYLNIWDGQVELMLLCRASNPHNTKTQEFKLHR